MLKKPSIEELKWAKNKLGISASETGASVRKKYRELIKKHHPDISGSAGSPESVEINRAYAIMERYIEGYVYSFEEADFARFNPEDAMMLRMKEDPVWGSPVKDDYVKGGRNGKKER